MKRRSFLKGLLGVVGLLVAPVKVELAEVKPGPVKVAGTSLPTSGFRKLHEGWVPRPMQTKTYLVTRDCVYHTRLIKAGTKVTVRGSVDNFYFKEIS